MNIKHKALWTNIPLFLFALILFSCEHQPAHAQTFVHSVNSGITAGYFKVVIGNLDKAVQGDQLILYINSPGGEVVETLALIRSMRKTKAHIICKADSAVSAAAMIFMVCDEKITHNNAVILFHFPRLEGDVYPVVPKYINKGDKGKMEFFKMNKLIYVGLGIKALLTKTEWFNMVNGEDVVLTGPEFNRRMARLGSGKGR